MLKDFYLEYLVFGKFEIFLWKKVAFDCAGIQAQDFRLPVDCFKQLGYTSIRHLFLHRKTSLYRPVALSCGCNKERFQIL